MSNTVSREFLQHLPKAELHVHVEGTLEPELKLILAKRNNITLAHPTIEELKASYVFCDLPSFLDVYYEGMSVLIHEQDFYDLAWAYLTKAKANNVRHVEMFFDPQAHQCRGVSYETVISGLTRACSDAVALGVDCKLIQCFLRDFSRVSAQEVLDYAKQYAQHIIGIGLDSDEHNNPPLKFYYQYEQAMQAGFHATGHADIDQINSIGHIQELLEVLNVERVDHGTNIVENPDLVALAKKRGIGFTSCPISNSFVGADIKDKEVKQLLDAGVLVSIHSDDPAYFGGYITDNYERLYNGGLFSKEDMVELAKNSFKASWISPVEKDLYLREIDEYVAATN